jgi:hypothetical protein
MASDNSYTSEGTIQLDNGDSHYQAKGLYKLAIDSMLVYLVNDKGISSVYVLENIKCILILLKVTTSILFSIDVIINNQLLADETRDDVPRS